MKQKDQRRFSKRTRFLFVLGVIAIYLGSYTILSSNGEYVWTQSGEVRYSFDMAMTDLEQWQPYKAHCQIFRSISGRLTLRGNFLGYLYSPLIIIDQKFIHPTKRIVPVPKEQVD
jgi:hypothetical protein